MKPYIYEQQQVEILGVVGFVSALQAYRALVAVEQAWEQADEFWGQFLWPLGRPPSPFRVQGEATRRISEAGVRGAWLGLASFGWAVRFGGMFTLLNMQVAHSFGQPIPDLWMQLMMGPWRAP